MEESKEAKPLMNEICSQHNLPQICLIEDSEKNLRLCAICVQEYFHRQKEKEENEEKAQLEAWKRVKEEVEQVLA